MKQKITYRKSYDVYINVSKKAVAGYQDIARKLN